MGIRKILRRIAFFVLSGLALYTWLRPQHADEQLEFESVSMTTAQSDYYLEGFQILQSDLSGQTEYTLYGDLLSYNPETTIADLFEPHLSVAQPGGPTWVLTADRGSMPRNGRQISLIDSVELVRTLPDGSQPSTLVTEQVDIDIDSGQLQGNAPVTMTGPGWQIDASAMSADTRQGALKLTGRAYGHYNTQTD